MRSSGIGHGVSDIVDLEDELDESLEADPETAGWSRAALPEVQVPLQGLEVQSALTDSRVGVKSLIYCVL